jgi:exonuclease III
VLVAAREGSFTSIEKMTGESEDGEKNVLAVQIKYPNLTMRVIVGHAPQETDKPDDRERFFESLKVEVERGQLNGEKIIVMGDMNGRIDGGDETKRNSPNGQSLEKFKDEHKLHIANFHPNAMGKWTRIQQKSKGEVKSAIDYVILDEFLYDSMTEMIIDECKVYTPYWITSKKKEKRVTSSDHCAMIRYYIDSQYRGHPRARREG